MQTRNLTIGLFIAVAVLGTQLSGFSLNRPHRANGDTKFTVRIENISSKDGQTASDGTRWPFALSPGLWVAHEKDITLFKEGQAASKGLEMQAEDGNPEGLVKMLEAQHHNRFALSFVSSLNRCRCRRGSNYSDGFVLLWRVAAHTDRPDDFAIHGDRYASLQRRCSSERESRHSAIANLIFKYPAWPPKDRCGACLGDAHLNASNLCVVQTMQHQQVAAVIDDCDHDGRAALDGFSFGQFSDLLGYAERQNSFRRQVGPGS